MRYIKQLFVVVAFLGLCGFGGVVPSGGNSGSGGGGTMVAGLSQGTLANDGAMGSGGSTLTSASAHWTSAITGDTVCVQGAGPSNAQKCGTATYLTPTTLTTSFTNSSGGAISGEQYVLGPLNDTALTAAMTATATTGGTLLFPAGVYLFSATQSFTCGVSQNWQGAGAGMSSYRNVTGGNTTTLYNGTGTYLDWASTTMSTPAAQLTSTSGVMCHQLHTFKDMVIYGGVGMAGDGGGNDGIDVLNQEHTHFDHVVIANFTGSCLALNALGAGDWNNNFTFRNGGIYYCGSTTGALAIGGSVAGGVGGLSYSADDIESNEILNNYGPGVYINAGQMDSTSIRNNNFGWDAQSVSSGAEINIAHATFGNNDISYNHIETYTSGVHFGVVDSCSGHCFNIVGNGFYGHGNTQYAISLGQTKTATADAINVADNTIESGGSSFAGWANVNWVDPASTGCGTNNSGGVGGTDPMCVFYNAANQPLPTCTTNLFAHSGPVRVSDETSACTAGNTYASGGSNSCYVQCNGTNWKVNGVVAY